MQTLWSKGLQKLKIEFQGFPSELCVVITMAETVIIGFFLEDIGQERFIKAIVSRIASEINFDLERLTFDVRNATGGGGIAVSEYKRFVKDYNFGRASAFDVLIVAIDGNCKGPTEVRNRLDKISEEARYPGHIVYAIPDPHIEKWYMADIETCQKVIQCPETPVCPPYKCEKGRYKQALQTAIKSAGVISLQGGTEYAPEIASLMNIFNAGKQDPSLKRFMDDLRTGLLALK